MGVLYNNGLLLGLIPKMSTLKGKMLTSQNVNSQKPTFISVLELAFR